MFVSQKESVHFKIGGIMKKMIFALMIALAGFSVNAQNTATEVVLKSVANRTDIVLVSGKLIDIATMKPIADAKLNLAKTNGIISAVVDENGNYALALAKSAVNKNARIEFNVKGYEVALKKVAKSAESVGMDIRLLPDESQQPVIGKYSAVSADPFNALVMNF